MSYTNQRIAYGNALVQLGRENKNIVALEADLGKSTMSNMFQQEFPDRYFEMGIAEQNMASTAAGLSLTGKIPFIHSFAVFSTGRAFDQIRQTISIGRLNVNICGSSAGLSDFGDGSTHQSVEDIAIMRAIPNMTVFCPVDANETGKVVRAMAEIDGPCYIRINRNDYENVISEDTPFQVGMPTVLKDGSDIAVFTIGIMAIKALEAAKALEGKISLKVINVSTIKPLNTQVIIDMAKNCKAVITAEEHSIIGGLGSAIVQALSKECKPIEFIGINDTFGCSARGYDELLDYFGLTSEAIIQAAQRLNK
ncbi:transketolase family protein [Mahella australiensis]|uniref:Transketolase subunit B n=1 Tax=Mahella australiensis (strain DSM 15567 / CIP 107919 / 50-1 BON) TaxID=697281 RepID=F3ZYU4_MAHA5|nr:transketolase C-terminal domain-containing protein [Mahella australiensis]AEE95689.1 transketolase subunit B [Mahella australiensis 50-1 BON]